MAKTPQGPAEPESVRPDKTDVVGRWGLIVLAGLTGLAALVRIFAPSELSIPQRIDQTTLLYFAVAGALLLLHKVKSFSLGDLKFEVFEKLLVRQIKQEEKIDDIALILPLLLPDKEIRHLKNLAGHNTAGYRGNQAVRSELRRLRSMGLVASKPNQRIVGLKDGTEFDLANHVELTPLGRHWAARLWDVEEPGDEAKPSETTEEKAGTTS